MSSKNKNKYKFITGISMISVMIFMIMSRSFDEQLFDYISYFSCILVLVMCWREIQIREAYLLSICLVLSILSIYVLKLPLDVFLSAISQATFLMAFLLFLSLLNEAASTSNSVKKCGEYLTRQHSNRRYFSIFIGTNIMAVLFNLGIISLLSPLIKKNNTKSAKRSFLINFIEQRQTIAMLRGFSWCVVWSPTAIAPVVLIEMINGIDRFIWSIYGIVIATVMCLIGWIEEKFQTKDVRNFNTNLITRKPFPVKAFLKFTLILFFLFGLTIFFTVLSSDTIVFGLIVSCPVVMFSWIIFQNNQDKQKSISSKLSKIFFVSLPKNSSIIITLCCSGYIGIVTSKMVSIDYITSFVDIYALPEYLFLLIISILIVPFSWLGVSPIMMAVFFGSMLGSIKILPTDPTLVALAVSAGWALSMTSSPFATVVLMISKLNKYSTIKLTFIWNSLFSILAIAVLYVIFYFLTNGQ